MQFIKPTTTLACISLGALFVHSHFTDASSPIYKNPITLTRLVDPETAHSAALWFMRHSSFPRDLSIDSPLLKTTMWGKTMSNPIGVAAGMDKDGECIDWLFGIGFGAVEIGSITPMPQPGNDKPRMFRLVEDKALINRMGFNSSGHNATLQTLCARMQEYVRTHPSISPTSDSPLNPTLGSGLTARMNASLKPGKLLGINLGKNKKSNENRKAWRDDEAGDFVEGLKAFWGLADYFVVNVSSPNTVGLRGLQEHDRMLRALTTVVGERDRMYDEGMAKGDAAEKVPVVVKIAPDLKDAEVRDIADVCTRVGIDGVVIGNSSVGRAGLVNTTHVHESGGLSGPPIRDLTLSVIRQFYKATQGRIPIIGCGGISNAQDAVEYAKAGASFVQMYTVLGYEGPGVVREIKKGVVAILEEAGGQRWSEIVGSGHDKE